MRECTQYYIGIHGAESKRKSAFLYAPRQMSACKLYLCHTRICLSSYIYVPFSSLSFFQSFQSLSLSFFLWACCIIRSEEFQCMPLVYFLRVYTQKTISENRICIHIHNASIHMWHRGIPIPISSEIFALLNGIQCL